MSTAIADPVSMPMQFMPSYHEPGLVALSVLIAIVASYAALDLAGRVTAATGWLRGLWLSGGAVAMGVGIWSMHFIAMLAFHLPVPVLYHVPTVALSLLAASLASAIALWIVSRHRMGLWQAIPGSILMGSAIAVMHYTGMAAMRLQGSAHYDRGLVALSVAIAIAVSFVALWLAFRLRGELGERLRWLKLGSAVLMGAAIPSMHYTAMAAVHYGSAGVSPAAPHGLVNPALGWWIIAPAALVILGLAILSAFAGRRLAAHEAALASSEDVRQAQEQFFRDVLDANPNLVFARDANGRYAVANRAFAAWYGLPPEAIVGKNDLELAGDAALIAQYLADDREVIASGQPKLRPEVTATNRLTGDTRCFEVIKVPMRSAGTAAPLALGIATDITHRRALEEQLTQAQKMEAVGLLAGGVAHDFNNMLTAILGRTDMLLDETSATDSRRSELFEIRRAAERAAGLTHQLLAFSRRQVLQPRVFELNRLVEDLLAMLRRLVRADIRLTALPGARRSAIKADPGQVEQVVMNLVLNARDAMPQGGRLTLETSELIVQADQESEHLPVGPGHYVVLAVSDTGIGMSAETKSHIFDPFFTTKPSGSGTGLGLATVYGIVKQSGGHIAASSELGIGSTFRIYFPRAMTPAVEVHHAPASPTRLRGSETILVVEDEDVVRRVTCTMLGKRGYQILVASNGDEALQLAVQHPGPIHLLLSDIVMPQLSGPELAERLRPIRPETRVLFTSGYTGDAMQNLGALETEVPFLQKPFTGEVLATRVREVLDAVTAR